VKEGPPRDRANLLLRTPFVGFAVSEHIIDMEGFRKRRPMERGTTFSVWGGDGERSRFALPIWRAIYLIGGERGGIVWLPEDPEISSKPTPFFVLDLAAEPARTDFDATLMARLVQGEPPAVEDEHPTGVAIYLGADGSRRWFLVVSGGEGQAREVVGKSREDLLFLAGECSGLLFHRDLGAETDLP
jgi:hypothetical protein